MQNASLPKSGAFYFYETDSYLTYKAILRRHIVQPLHYSVETLDAKFSKKLLEYLHRIKIMPNFAPQNRNKRSISVAVSTPPSHGGDSGSSPGSTTQMKI